MTVLIIEKMTEVCEGSGAILLPGVEKGIEIALRTDEERAELPKRYKVIADPGAPGSQIETRNSKLETRKCISMLKKVLLAIALMIVVLSVVGCQTVQGVGGDISWIGKAGQDVVEK